MSNVMLAVPCEVPGGLAALASPHFGRAPFYTIVEIVDGQVDEVRVLENVDHEEGGCLGPVNFLAALGVTAVVVGGLGRRPLAGLLDKGIRVCRSGEQTRVAELVADFSAGRLDEFSLEHVCGGGCAH